MTDNATPRPWEFDDNEGYGPTYIRSVPVFDHSKGTRPGKTIAVVVGDSAEAEANRDLIITAVNERDGLLTSLANHKKHIGELEEALEGLLSVVHDYVPSMARGCLQFQERINESPDERNCFSTGLVETGNACEICSAKAALKGAAK